MNVPAASATGAPPAGDPVGDGVVSADGANDADGAVARPPALRALDASMGLLKDIEHHSLDPGYAQAGPRVVPGPRARAVTLLLTAAVAVIMVASVLALRAPQPGGEDYRRSLQERIEALTGKVADGERENASLRAEIAQIEESALGASAVQDLDRWEIRAAQRAMTGPGVVLTLDDAPGARDELPGDDPSDPGPAEGLVQDRDLQTVVNGLWAAGAEAVGVNNQRLTTTSAIRSAGSAILVDYRPLSPPYLVSAIGPAADLQADFAGGVAGAYVQYLENNYGIRVTIETPEALRLPAARPVVLHYARPISDPAASSSSGTSSGRSRSAASSEDLP